MPLRVLAVGHDAYRAGAQIAFLHVLRWLEHHGDVELSIVLRRGGDLLDEYRALAPTRVLADESSSLARRLSGRLLPRRSVPAIARGSIDVVYANSATTARLARELGAGAGCPVVCHVHELAMAMRRFTNPERFRETASGIDAFVAVSQAVADQLTGLHGIEPHRVHVINEGITLPEVPADADERQRALRADSGIEPGDVVVGGCGTVDWRKGPDVFAQVAAAVARRDGSAPRVHFVWVGGEPDQLAAARHDVDRLGVADTVHFVGPRPDPLTHFLMFDLYLLSSREDPFPLAALEAAALGAPILCYEQAGGMPEFVDDDAGVVLPYLDVEATARTIVELAGDEQRRRELGRRAAEKVAERCSIDVIGPRVADVLGAAAR